MYGIRYTLYPYAINYLTGWMTVNQKRKIPLQWSNVYNTYVGQSIIVMLFKFRRNYTFQILSESSVSVIGRAKQSPKKMLFSNILLIAFYGYNLQACELAQFTKKSNHTFPQDILRPNMHLKTILDNFRGFQMPTVTFFSSKLQRQYKFCFKLKYNCVLCFQPIEYLLIFGVYKSYDHFSQCTELDAFNGLPQGHYTNDLEKIWNVRKLEEVKRANVSQLEYI